jgi:hypothetical protein
LVRRVAICHSDLAGKLITTTKAVIPRCGDGLLAFEDHRSRALGRLDGFGRLARLDDATADRAPAHTEFSSRRSGRYKDVDDVRIGCLGRQAGESALVGLKPAAPEKQTAVLPHWKRKFRGHLEPRLGLAATGDVEARSDEEGNGGVRPHNLAEKSFYFCQWRKMS